MKQSISHWQIAGFLFTSIFGTFLHFLFDLSGQSIAAALFSAVNESIWEHMKLIYYPMLLFALVEYRFWGKDHKQFWCVKLAGIMLALYLIPTLYYTYTGIFGTTIDWLNIAIFYLAAGAAFWLENQLFQQEYACRLHSRIAFFLILLIGIVFTVWTFFPPHIPFFQDPVTGSYGFAYMPDRDYRAVYSMDTRLAALADDEAAQGILLQEAPALFGVLQENNREFTTQAFRELSNAFFLGMNPQKIEALVDRLSQLRY